MLLIKPRLPAMPLSNVHFFASWTLAVIATLPFDVFANDKHCAPWLDHRIDKLHADGQHDVCQLSAGRPVLLVNTASHCGFTHQFSALESLYQRYKADGLVIIGFPSNDFNQEAASAQETATVCYTNYGVSFPMVSEVRVKGTKAHPIFKQLAKEQGSPGWNFTKYLVDRNGKVVATFSTRTSPDSSVVRKAINSLL